jgi:hypothetical protein
MAAVAGTMTHMCGRRIAIGVKASEQPHPPSSTVVVAGTTALNGGSDRHGNPRAWEAHCHG